MKAQFVVGVFALLGCGGGETANDAGVDAANDVVDATVDVLVPDASSDAFVDAASDAGTDAKSAASTCASAVAPDASVVYTGTTCDGTDSVTIACNKTGHKEVYVRIDGTAGQVWSVKAEGAFAVGVWDNFNETTCGPTPNLESCPAADAGSSGVVDGPFPAARSDFFMFETPDPTPCGPYTIDVTLM